MESQPFFPSESEEAAKFRNLDAPGLKELPCGCICEVKKNCYIEVLRACSAMQRVDMDANEQLGPGDEVFDHIYDGIMAKDWPCV